MKRMLFGVAWSQPRSQGLFPGLAREKALGTRLAWFISSCRLSPPKKNDSRKHFRVRRLWGTPFVRQPTENLQGCVYAVHFVCNSFFVDFSGSRTQWSKTDLPDVRLNVLPIVLGSSGRGDNQFTKEPTSGTCRNRPLRRQTQSYSWSFHNKLACSSYCVTVQARVVLERTVIGDWRFDNLSGSHLQSQVNSVCQSGPLKAIGQLSLGERLV